MSLIRLEPEIPYSEAVAEVAPEKLVEVSGQSIFVEDIGSGPAVVMLHGFASSSFSFRELFERFADSYRVIAIDLNGFGLTQRPVKAEHYRVENQADLIIEVLKSKGIENAILIGHSYGAVVSAALASRIPERVPAVILISPPSDFGKKPPWYLRNAIGLRVAFFLIRALLSNPEKFHELSSKAVYRKEVLPLEISEIYRRAMLTEGLKKACFGYARAFAGRGAEAIRYEAIRQATLVIAGEQDEVVSAESSEEVSQKIPHGNFVLIPQCGHCPPEERPEVVTKAVFRFLQSR